MRKRALLFSFSFLLFVFLLFPTGVCAAEASAEEISQGLLEKLGAILPDAARDTLKSDTPSAEGLREAVGFKQAFALLGSALSGALGSGTVGKLLGVTLLFSAASLLGSFFGKNRFSEIFFSAAPILLLYSLFTPLITRVFSFLTDLSSFCALLSPLYVALFSAGGAISGAAVASGGFAAFVGVLEGIVLGLLSPLLKILLALALLSPFSFGTLAGEIEKRIRSAFLWILSLVGFLLCTSLAFEGALASSADSLTLRTAKFAVGQSIPLVGGAVSSVLGTLSATLSLVKSSLGAGALIALLALLLPVLAELILMRVTLSLCSLAATAMGAGSVGSVCERYRGILDLLLAACAISAVMFLLTVGVFSRMAV